MWNIYKHQGRIQPRSWGGAKNFCHLFSQTLSQIRKLLDIYTQIDKKYAHFSRVFR